MRQRVAQLATLMNRAWHFGRHVAGDTLRPRELPKQPLQAVAVAFDGRVVLGVRAFQITVRHDAWPAMARTHDVNHVQVVFFNQPVQVNIQKVQTRRRAPMAQQARLDVGERERTLEQRVVLQVNLPDRQVVCGTPVSVYLLQGVRGQGIRHRSLSGSLTFTVQARGKSPHRRWPAPLARCAAGVLRPQSSRRKSCRCFRCRTAARRTSRWRC